MEKKLMVYMLSGFCIMYGDDVLPMQKFGNSKLLELFQILLRYKKSGISREQLQQMLYEDDSVTDKSHSLDSLVYRLKRVLGTTEIIQDEYIHIKNGIYKWNEQIPVTVDVLEFETFLADMETAEPEEKKKLLVKAFYLYELEFLENRPIRPWIIEERVRLKKLYAACVSELGRIFEEEKDYQSLYELYSKAAQIYPYDEWQTGQILALQYMNRYEDAYKCYHTTVKKYFDELGFHPSQKMLDIIQTMGDSVMNPIDSLDTIKQRLTEEGECQGAYYCTYPSFVDIYRYITRTIERSGQSVFMMVCSIYYLNPTGRKSPRAGEILQEVIGSSLRKGDSYTRYCDNQFVILLMGTQNEDCELIFERIRKNFKKGNRNSNCELDYVALPVQDVREEGGELRFRNSENLWK